jgi:hypothetical protein
MVDKLAVAVRKSTKASGVPVKIKDPQVIQKLAHLMVTLAKRS